MTSRFLERLEPRRLLSAGELDTSFGDQGVEIIASNRYVETHTVAGAVQGDGKTLLAGSLNYATVAVIARFQISGQPDPTFGSNGMVTIGFPGRAFTVSSIV